MTPWKHALWVVPLLALVTVSLVRQARQSPAPGARMEQALGQQLPAAIRQAPQFFEYLPPARDVAAYQAAGLTLDVCGRQLVVPVNAAAVTLDVPDWPEFTGREVELALSAPQATSSRWPFPRTLHRAAEMPKPGEGLALAILGNTFRLPHEPGILVLTSPSPAPPLTLAVRTDTWQFTSTPSRAGSAKAILAQSLHQPAVAAALQAAGLIPSTAAQVAEAARQRLLRKSDEELLLALLQADAGVLQELADRDRAAELAVCLAAWDPAGAVAFFRRDGRTVYVLTTRQLMALKPVPCLVFAFDAKGRERWHGQITHPDGGPAMLAAVYHLSGFTPPAPPPAPAPAAPSR